MLDQVFIKPQIRGGRLTCPPEYQRYPAYPLQDLTVGGSMDVLGDFKMMAWRSLSGYRDAGLTYDYLDAYALVDIMFDRLETYASARQLASLGLLVLLLGLADVPNKLLPSLIVQALTLRRDVGRPTWIFCPFSYTRMEGVYGQAVAELVGPVGSVFDPSHKEILAGSGGPLSVPTRFKKGK